MPRIAIVSTTVPPGASGQARALGHLVGSPAEQNCLMLADQLPFPLGTSLEAFPNYRILSARPAVPATWLPTSLPTLQMLAGCAGALWGRVREINTHVAAFGAQAIVACTASPFDIPASTLVALRRRLPLLVHLFDDPVYQWAPGPLRTFAAAWEPLWSRTAANVIAPNELMIEEFARRRSRQPVLVRNSVASGAFASSDRPWPAEVGRFRIVYTGSVYHAHTDAFLDLLTALQSLPDWSLHLYTSQSEAEVAAYGIKGPNVVRHDHVDQQASYAVQQAADVLFLPLAFRSRIQEVLRTAAPGKLGEYLASGRPILAHAPADSFVIQHVKQHQAGYVIDTPDVGALTAALRSIAADPGRRRMVCDNAARLAETYRVDQARAAFWNTVTAAVARRTG